MIKTIVYIAVFYFLWQTGLLAMMFSIASAFFLWLAVLVGA